MPMHERHLKGHPLDKGVLSPVSLCLLMGQVVELKELHRARRSRAEKITTNSASSSWSGTSNRAWTDTSPPPVGNELTDRHRFVSLARSWNTPCDCVRLDVTDREYTNLVASLPPGFRRPDGICLDPLPPLGGPSGREEGGSNADFNSATNGANAQSVLPILWKATPG